MVYPSTHYHITANGHFGGASNPLDFWSAGFRVGLTSGLDVPNVDLTGVLTAIAPYLATLHGATDLKAGDTTFLTQLKGARIGPDNKYSPSAQITQVYNYPSPVPGNSLAIGPWSQAWVVSLRTALPRGYASNGRIYWPSTSNSLQSTDGMASTARTGGAVAAWKTALDAINTTLKSALLEPNMAIMVMSAVGAGKAAKVTGIRMDRRLDSQERRENNQNPQYTAAVIA